MSNVQILNEMDFLNYLNSPFGYAAVALLVLGLQCLYEAVLNTVAEAPVGYVIFVASFLAAIVLFAASWLTLVYLPWSSLTIKLLQGISLVVLIGGYVLWRSLSNPRSQS